MPSSRIAFRRPATSETMTSAGGLHGGGSGGDFVLFPLLRSKSNETTFEANRSGAFFDNDEVFLPCLPTLPLFPAAVVVVVILPTMTMLAAPLSSSRRLSLSNRRLSSSSSNLGWSSSALLSSTRLACRRHRRRDGYGMHGRKEEKADGGDAALVVPLSQDGGGG